MDAVDHADLVLVVHRDSEHLVHFHRHPILLQVRQHEAG